MVHQQLADNDITYIGVRIITYYLVILHRILLDIVFM